MLRPLVSQNGMDLVRDDASTVGCNDSYHLLDLANRQTATGRVPRIAEDQRAGSLPKGPIHSVDVDPVHASASRLAGTSTTDRPARSTMEKNG
ncbi:MAG: hypothetical protein V3U46_04725 [Acidimicrobiia bacterium]